MLVAKFAYKNGTSLELHQVGTDAGKTVYIDETGWRTSNHWTKLELAQVEYEGFKARAQREGKLEEAGPSQASGMVGRE
jgi:hypothetical protein